MASEVLIFQYKMGPSFMYFLVPVISLGSIRLCIMCIGTIAGWNSTEGQVLFCYITSDIFHYFDNCMATAFGIL